MTLITVTTECDVLSVINSLRNLFYQLYTDAFFYIQTDNHTVDDVRNCEIAQSGFELLEAKTRRTDICFHRELGDFSTDLHAALRTKSGSIVVVDRITLECTMPATVNLSAHVEV